ncbi:23476_t:CDS:2 [Racocetra persica]|uniref:23476_t:CDS:1 n=1 Tax=Racocetra persica TaxID=160502 RepID=A0ACA9QNY2_9GLOM|nr:23476_t:CDS:2 [Racocetra persica]
MPVDYIEYILNNPTIAPNLYFGPSIIYNEKHKTIKFARIRSVVKVNKSQLLRADLLVLYSGLPGHLYNMNRKAYRMNMEELWLVEGQTDLPQSNNLASVLRHNANYGCRTCFVSSSQLTNSNLNFIANARFYHLTNIQYNKIVQQQTNSAHRQLSSQYELSAKPVLETLYWNRHLQSPQDAYHALADKATYFLDITLRYLNTNKEVAWLKY